MSAPTGSTGGFSFGFSLEGVKNFFGYGRPELTRSERALDAIMPDCFGNKGKTLADFAERRRMGRNVVSIGEDLAVSKFANRTISNDS